MLLVVSDVCGFVASIFAASYIHVIVAIKAVYLYYRVVLVLLVFGIKMLAVDGLAKSKIGIGDVGAVVIVKSAGADVLVV